MSATRDEVREAVARAIACGLGDNFDHAFVTKAEWTQARGEKGGRTRDINEPMQGDYLDAADAALAAAEQAGWVLVPVQATEEMIEEGCGIDCTRTVCRARLECRDASGQAIMREKWAAMLNAAPKATP